MALTLLNLPNPPAPDPKFGPGGGPPGGLGKMPHEPEIGLEYGTTGTGIFGQGYIRELGEYNPDFSGGPFTSYRTFEKMRRGDAQVAATTMAMKLPVRSAEWTVRPPENATPIEKECAEFIEECIFDDIDFDRGLENLLLSLDFGAACHEDIWEIVNGQVRLKKAAARMPLTFYTWTIDTNEDLVALVQHGFHGGYFSTFTLPADKICLYTFRQEGANFAGRAILREMYQHWYTKGALYKIDAIAAERNGMGVPTGTLGPGATKEDRETFEKFLSQVAAHQSLYLMQPNGYKFELVGVTGTVRDCKDSITHHNMQISMAALNTFMLMGQTSRGSGNRSLGETMSDFFFLSLQSLANQIGKAWSESTIKRLALYNYGEKVRPPNLVPQRLIAMKFESIVDALAKLGTAKILTPDPDIEVWVREEMGAPAALRADIVRMRQAMTTVGKPAAGERGGGGAGAGGETPGGGGTGDGGGKNGKRTEGAKTPSEDKSSGKAAMSEGDGGAPEKVLAAEVDGVKVRRAPVGAERCLALSEIVGALDKGRDDVAVALRAARGRVQAEIVHKMVDAPVAKMHRVSVALDEKLGMEIEGILRGIAEFGRGQIGQEREKQRAAQRVGAPLATPTAAKIRGAEDQEPVGLYADAVVSEFEGNLQRRAANVALDKQRQGGKTKGELITEIGEELDDQSDKWIDGVASKGANEAFAEGRAQGFEDYADEIDHFVYSALLDINTCENCAAADGAEGTEDEVPDVPNPDCDGGDLCRCVLVAVFKDEGGAA